MTLKERYNLDSLGNRSQEHKPDPVQERRYQVEIELALAAGVKKLKEHPHHR